MSQITFSSIFFTRPRVRLQLPYHYQLQPDERALILITLSSWFLRFKFFTYFSTKREKIIHSIDYKFEKRKIINFFVLKVFGRGGGTSEIDKFLIRPLKRRTLTRDHRVKENRRRNPHFFLSKIPKFSNSRITRSSSTVYQLNFPSKATNFHELPPQETH